MGLWHKLAGIINDKRNVCALVLGFFCGMFNVGGFSPLAPACFICYVMLGKRYYTAAVGIALGIVAGVGYGYVIPFLICVILCTIWILWQGKGNVRQADKLLILAIAQMSMIFLRNDGVWECAAVLINCTASVIMCILMYNAMRSISLCIGNRRLMSGGDIISVCIMSGICVLLLYKVKTEDFSLATIVSGCITMLGASVCSPYGLCLAVISSVGAGFMNDGLFSLATVGITAVCAILCSLVREYGKAAVALMYAAGAVLLGVFASGCMSYIDCAVAVLLFTVIPKKVISLADAYTSAGKNNGEAAVIQKQLRMIARATSGMSDALGTGELNGDGSFAMRQFGAISRLLDSIDEDDRTVRSTLKADVGMACIPKNNCAHTGDSVSVTELKDKAVIAVSDGMGSGILAHNESSAAVETFAEMISAGFNINDSVDCVNRRLLARCPRDFYATLDALIIDKTSAYAHMVKMGAPPSFLLREGKVYDICAESLPLGILETVTPAVKKLKLKHDDVIFIFTDGVFDALSSELVASMTDTAAKGSDPTQTARDLLDIAASGGADDDMSIVCIRIKRSV